MTDRPSARMKQRLNIWLSLPVAAILIYTVATIFSVSIKDGKKWQSLANAQQLKSTAVQRQEALFMIQTERCFLRAQRSILFMQTLLCSKKA